MNLGERIYQLRAAKNLSQEDLADALEVSRQSVSKWETGGSVPELDKLVKLCEIFEVSMDHLVRGVGPEAAQPSSAQGRKETNILACVVVGAVLLLTAGFYYAVCVRIMAPRLGLLVSLPIAVISILLLIIALCAAVRRRGRRGKQINRKGSEYETTL